MLSAGAHREGVAGEKGVDGVWSAGEDPHRTAHAKERTADCRMVVPRHALVAGERYGRWPLVKHQRPMIALGYSLALGPERVNDFETHVVVV